MTDTVRIGSLFSGAGGLDLAVANIFGGEVVWHAEIDKAASKVLAHHWPDVPNLGDITQIDFRDVEKVDILCGGFPCQDVSAAGKRAGIKAGTRSGLWALFANAIDVVRPRLVVIENVRGLLSARAHRNLEPANPTVGDRSDGPVLRAAGAVLGDLADLRYDAIWATAAAADVGAPHRRERVFILATDTERRSGARFPHTAGYSETDSQGRQTVLAGRRSSAHGGGDSIAADASSSTVGLFAGGSSAEETRADSGDRPSDHRGKRVDGVELLPTPQSMDGSGGRVSSTLGGQRPSGAKRSITLSTAVHHNLLPTPCVVDRLATTDMSLDQWDQSRQSQKERGVGSFGPRGDTLGAAVLRAHSGTVDQRPDYSSSRKDDQVALLPTPSTHDKTGARSPESIARMDKPFANLNDTAVNEFAVKLLPTPTTQDGANNAGPSQFERNTLPLNTLVTVASAWGKYEPAIRRWEALTRPAPAPTEPNKNGNPRLSAEFSQWLMGWPDGWVTDPDICISRNDQLRIIGNGVCPQQAVHALRFLLSVAAGTHTHTQRQRADMTGLLPTPKAHDGVFGTPRTSGRPIEKSTHLQTIVSLIGNKGDQ